MSGRTRKRRMVGTIARTTGLGIATFVLLIPIVTIIYLSLQPSNLGGEAVHGFTLTLTTYVDVFEHTKALRWLANSLIVTTSATLISVVVAAPAGYVLSRASGALARWLGVSLFVVQSLPAIVFVIPLFLLFVGMGIAGNLVGVIIAYVATTMAVACWMMSAHIDTIPMELEEAGWVDGCSHFGAFVRVVLPNTYPGLLSTAIFAFLHAWNDYLIAVILIRDNRNYTLPVGLTTFFQEHVTDWSAVMVMAVVMMMPPLIVFAALNRYFSFGGVSGALAGK